MKAVIEEARRCPEGASKEEIKKHSFPEVQRLSG
jgi:hypothetical protein